jgi:hypothetical protein
LNRFPAGAAATPGLLRLLLNLHYQLRFDPNGLSAADRSDFRQKVADWLAEDDRRPGAAAG